MIRDDSGSVGDMKRVICLIGLPGSGKSSAAKFLEETIHCRSLHLPAVVGHLLPAEQVYEARRRATLLVGVEEAFFAEIDKTPGQIVILDGFLRSIPRLRLLQEAAAERSWRAEIIYLHMPILTGSARSLSRQFTRDLSQGKEFLRPFRKLKRDIRALPNVVNEALRLRIPIHSIDATLTIEQVQYQIFRYVNH